MTDFNVTHFYLDDTLEEETEDIQYYGDIKDKPETEQKLFELQDKWITTKDPKVWSEMYLEVSNYMRSLILKKLKNKVFLEKEVIDDKNNRAVIKFMSQFLTNPNFKIGASFAGMMKYPVLEVLYGKNEKVNLDSLERVLSDDNATTLGDTIHDEKFDELYSDDTLFKVTAKDIFKEVLYELDKTEVDSKTKALIHLYLILCIRGPKNRHSKRVFQNSLFPDYKKRKVLDLTLLEIYNRLKELG